MTSIGDLIDELCSDQERGAVSIFSGIAGRAFHWEELKLMKLYTPKGLVEHDEVEPNEVVWANTSARYGLRGSRRCVEGQQQCTRRSPSANLGVDLADMVASLQRP